MNDVTYIPSMFDDDREYKIIFVPRSSPVFGQIGPILKENQNHDKTHSDRYLENTWSSFFRLTRGWKLCTHYRVFNTYQLTFCRPKCESP